MLIRHKEPNKELNPEWWIMEGLELLPTEKAPDWLKAEYEDYLKEKEEYNECRKKINGEFDMLPPLNPIFGRMSKEQKKAYMEEKGRLLGLKPINWDELGNQSSEKQ